MPFVDFLGPGIFSSDGKAWQHSRAMVSPNFTRHEVDVVALEAHVSHLVRSIPPDVSTVDLQDLFFRLAMDYATEFLFGKSSTLDPAAHDHFAEAFNYCTQVCFKRQMLGTLSYLIPDSKYKDAKRTINAFADTYIQEALTLCPKTSNRYIFMK